MKKLILTILLFIHAFLSKAQDYPVTISTQIIPPYTTFLPDYPDKLRVILLQRDMTQPSYDVSLQMTIELNGSVIMRTAPYYHPQPINLTAGIPLIISGTSLTDFFLPDHLVFTGSYTRDTYERSKTLPEGTYRLSFTAYDNRRPDIRVSTTIPSVFFLQKTDPPLLNLPVCNSRVDKRDPQFVTFSWSSRNTTQQNTAYTFSLYEIKPAGSNPDYIIRSTRPIYTTTTDNTTILYGPSEPLLTDTMQYTWIVQAIDKEGKDLYSNQGFSKSCTFTYKGTNPFEQYQVATPILYGSAGGARQIRYHWPQGSEHITAYQLQYRAAARDNINFDWQTTEIKADTSFILNSLEPGRTYEARLQYELADVYSAFSDILAITTPPLPVMDCGTATQPVTVANDHLQPSLAPGNILRIGFFDVLLTDVAGSNGIFSGSGKVITVGFGFGLQVAFKQVTVNTDLVVTRGEMHALTDGINKFVKDGLAAQYGGNDMGHVKTGDLVADITTYLHLLTKDAIVVNTISQTIILKDSSQSEVRNYTRLPLLIEDAAGNIYQVNDKGQVNIAGKRDVMLAANAAGFEPLSLSAGRVEFTPGNDNLYAFDPGGDTLPGYYVPAKAMIPAMQETILAQRPDTGAITFVNGKGIILPADCDGNTCRVTITGGPAADAQEVYALTADGKSIGKMLVPSYPPLNKQVVMIPVGDNVIIPEQTILNTLQSVYGRIGITYTLTIDDSFKSDKTWDQDGDGILQDSRGALLSNGFTSEERAMKKAYRQSHKIDEHTAYLFVVNEAAMATADLLGKMPRQSQFGFIFSQGATASDISRSVAHETGHGDYTLEHVKDAPDNLMAGGLILTKRQWDIVHDPGSVWGIFEEDVASELTKGLSLYKCLQNEARTACDQPLYYTPDSMVIKLPEGAIPISVFYQDLGTRYPAMPGSLQAFQYREKEYTAIYFANTGRFKGYSYDRNDTGSFFYGRAKEPADLVNIIGFGKEVYSCNVVVNGVSFKNEGCLCQENQYTAQYNRLMQEVIGADRREVQDEIAAVCRTILALPADVLATNNELFECYYNKPDLYYLDWNNVPAVITFEQLQRMHTQLKMLDSSIAVLRRCAFATGEELVAFINAHFVIAGTKTSYLTGAQFSELSPELRACLIEKLLQGDYNQRWTVGSAGFGGQNMMLEILRGCKTTTELYKVIQILQRDGLLYTLIADTYDYLYVSDGIFTELCHAITVAWLQEEKPGQDVGLIQRLMLDKQWLVFDNGYLTAMNREALHDEQQRISFDVKDGAGAYLRYVLNTVGPGVGELFKDYGKATPFSGSFGPLDYLVVIPARDMQVFGTTMEKGIPYVLPAIGVYALFKEDTKAALEVSASLVLNTALCSVGMEGMVAAGGLHTTMEMVNVGLATFITYANAAPELAQDHPEFVKYSNYLAVAYMVGVLTTGTAKSIRNAKIAVPGEMMMGRFAEDVVEIEQRAVVLEEKEVAALKVSLKDVGDGNVYIVVQQRGNEYFVLNNGEEIALKHRSLGMYLDKIAVASKKEIILLSNGELASAQRLSDLLGRPVIVNRGWVRVYENGVIDGSRDFAKLEPGGGSELPVDVGRFVSPAGKYVLLGKADDAVWAGLKIYDNLSERVLNKADRLSRYFKEEVLEVVKVGMELGIPHGEIEDILYNGCRKTKNFTKSEIIEQMEFWDVVRKRGYPNLFNSLEEFEEFGDIVKGLVKEWELPGEVYIQGSALRIKEVEEVGDLDVAIMVGKEEFERLVERFKKNVKIETILRDFGKNGKIKGFNMYSENGHFLKEFHDRYFQKYGKDITDKININDIQISIIEKGNILDVSPYLMIK